LKQAKPELFKHNPEQIAGFRALVLGAAAGGGLPQWNCGCVNCNLARMAGGLVPQTQSSIAISADGQNWAILNASPDIRQQLLNTPALHPTGLRLSPIRSVLVTNGDIDHIAGLLTLREKQAFELVMTAAIADVLDANPIFRALDPAFVSRRIVSSEQRFELVAGVTAYLFPVPGKAPLFLEQGEPVTDKEDEQTVGVALEVGGKRIFHIPGCATVTPGLAERIRSADLVMFDGTLYTDAEMIDSGAGVKTGRRMGHISISGPDGSLAALAPLDIARILYIHINNTNPIWRDGPERRAVISEPCFEIGYDGMEIVL
jgi:pyrroloquinoline quinone biosynthesis protein B